MCSQPERNLCKLTGAPHLPLLQNRVEPMVAGNLVEVKANAGLCVFSP